MIKTILLTILFVGLVGSAFVLLFGKIFMSNLKSKDNDKRITAEEKLRKINIICYIVFFGCLLLMVIISKVFGG